MKHIIILLITFGFINSSYCQNNFLFEKQSLDYVRNYEKSINSKYVGFEKTQVSEDYFPTAKGNHDYYPLCYIRTNDTFFPELHIEYFYNEKDSTLLATSYDWNIMNYVKNLKTDGDKFDVEIKREKEYLNKYESIKKELIDKFGQPQIIEEDKTDEGYFYKLIWKNESTEILVLLKFSKKLKEFPGNMKFGSYNIRVKVDYLK